MFWNLESLNYYFLLGDHKKQKNLQDSNIYITNEEIKPCLLELVEVKRKACI